MKTGLFLSSIMAAVALSTAYSQDAVSSLSSTDWILSITNGGKANAGNTGYSSYGFIIDLNTIANPRYSVSPSFPSLTTPLALTSITFEHLRTTNGLSLSIAMVDASNKILGISDGVTTGNADNVTFNFSGENAPIVTSDSKLSFRYVLSSFSVGDILTSGDLKMAGSNNNWDYQSGSGSDANANSAYMWGSSGNSAALEKRYAPKISMTFGQAIPEPSVALLSVAGLSALMLRRRRR